MIRRILSETRFLLALAAAGVAASVAVFLVFALATDDPGVENAPSQEWQRPVEGPGEEPWELTGEYRALSEGIGLTVVSLSVSQDRMAFLFALDAASADQVVLPDKVYLVDDKGKQYEGTMTVLGSQLGVTGGVIVTEPYDGAGASLTMAMSGATVSSGEGPSDVITGDWAVRFAENRRPGPADYMINGKVAPEVTKFGDVTMTKAGGSPGLSYIELLIDRGGQQSAVYGARSSEGFTGLTQDEFTARLRAETGGDDMPVSPDFPQPAKQ
jgi:hypothetical protein